VEAWAVGNVGTAEVQVCLPMRQIFFENRRVMSFALINLLCLPGLVGMSDIDNVMVDLRKIMN
jgi:hypothetical protein